MFHGLEHRRLGDDGEGLFDVPAFRHVALEAGSPG